MALQDNVKSAMRTPIRSRWPLFELFMLVTVAVIGWAAWGSWELMTELDDSRRGVDRRRQQTQQQNRRGNENARLLELHAIRDDFMGFEKHVQPALQEMRAALRRYVQTSAAQEWKTFEWSRKTLASWMDRIHDLENAGLNATLLFNQIGKRIYLVGESGVSISGVPDIWEAARPVLDFQLGKKILKKQAEIRLNISNILNGTQYFYQNGDDNTGFQKGKDAYRFTRKFGSTYSITFNYSL